ncbi:MAG: RtcB family protein [Bacteroidales bacterium]
MRKIITSERIPIKMWLEDIDEDSLQQAKNLANLPFAFKHIALMPDTHLGYGMPIGAVLATKGAIIPNAVGVDIGCGMCAVESNIESSSLSKKELISIIDNIKKIVPLGFRHHKKEQSRDKMPQNFNIDGLKIVREEYSSALRQLGTLGGGNHFIELQKDQAGKLWIMIHSGSRNIGLKIAQHYNKIAKRLSSTLNPSIDPKWDLAYLPLNSSEANHYFQEMEFAISFAFANRSLMMERVKEVVTNHIKGVQYGPIINIAHNYAAREEHFGERVIVHRKGATAAFVGEVGIIPGSQGSSSYIVEGLGNPHSFKSCSHGAGRVMSRKKAIRELDLEREKERLDKMGILHSIRNRSHLEEATSAYKDITKVMELQNDLVKIKSELTPLAVIKG